MFYKMFTPDWMQFWTIEKMEKELAPFKFKGVGWYIKGSDTLLVIPNDVKYPDTAEKKYKVCCFNERDAHTIFETLASLPVLTNDKPPRKFGSAKGTIKFSPDFEIPPDLPDDIQALANKIVSYMKSVLHDEISGGGCKAFYNPTQWDEQYGQNCDLIICHDGGDAARFFNPAYEQYSVFDGMSEFLSKEGFYAEHCTSWYTAIYRIKNG